MGIALSRFRIITGVLLLGLVLLTSGCTQKQTSETQNEAEAGQSVVMTIWTTEHKAYFNALARQFVAKIETPNLQFKVVEFQSQRLMAEYFVDQLAEGLGPDIIVADGQWLAHHQAKLTPESGEDKSFTTEAFAATFVKVAQQLLLSDNQIWGVPLGVETLGLYFNDEHITERLPDRNLPGRTWIDFQEDVEDLTKADNSFTRFAASGAALGRSDNVTYSAEILENLLAQGSGDFYDPTRIQVLLGASQNTNNRASNPSLEAIGYYTSFADSRFKHQSWNNLIGNPYETQPDFKAFLRGHTSMVFGKPQDFKQLQTLHQELKGQTKKLIDLRQIRAAFLPQTIDPQLNADRLVIGNVKALAVSRTTKYPETAWELLKFAIGKENLQTWYETTHYPTPRVDMLASQETIPETGIFARQAKFAEANTGPIPKRFLHQSFNQAIAGVNQKQLTPGSALEQIVGYLSALLKEKNRLDKLTQ